MNGTRRVSRLGVGTAAVTTASAFLVLASSVAVAQQAAPMPPAGQCEALRNAADVCQATATRRAEACVARCERQNTACQDRMDRRNTAIVNASGCNRSPEPYACQRLAMSLVARCTAALGQCQSRCRANAERPCARRNEASRACAEQSRQARGQVARQWVVTLLAGDRDLSGRNLEGADLHGLDLRGVNLSGAHLEEANLTGANLAGANLAAAFFFNTDLTGANLSNADLTGANLSGVNFTGANLTNANLTRVACDANSVFTSAILAGSTRSVCRRAPYMLDGPAFLCGEWCVCPETVRSH